MRTSGSGHGWRRAVQAFTVAGSIVAVGLAGGTTPARADSLLQLSLGGATVGVQQPLSVTLVGLPLGSGAGLIEWVVDGVPIGTSPISGLLGAVSSILYTPPLSGTDLVQAAFKVGPLQLAVDSGSLTVAKAATTTALSAPATAATSTPVTLTATVAVTSGSYVPTGSVTFARADGVTLGTGTLDAAGHASMSYTTPAAASTVQVYADYGGDANAGSSRSATSTITVTGTSTDPVGTVPSTVRLSHTANAAVNTAVALTAAVAPSTATGTMQFSANGTTVATSTLSGGSATATWVPTTAGVFTITAAYSGDPTLAPSSATGTVQVTAALPINPSLKTDRISVMQVGAATPWTPGSTVDLPNGAVIQLATASLSGLPVTLGIAGPCSLTGLQLQVKGAGGCTLFASTAGDTTFNAATQQYLLRLGVGVQTARVLAPKSGAYRHGTRVRLIRKANVTNIGQRITWKVIRGKSHCTVYRTAAFVKLRMKSAGVCTVRGTAPGVNGQWTAFKVLRTYRIR